MLIKRTVTQRGGPLVRTDSVESSGFSRRNFLKQSGLAAGTLAGVSLLPQTLTRATAASSAPQPKTATTIRKNVCTHCSVGCTVIAEVQDGVWTGQEPAWDSPINRGTHCAKGASIREIVHGDRR